MLEARDRLGGRTRTVRPLSPQKLPEIPYYVHNSVTGVKVTANNGDGIDLGAHWIGRTQHHLLEATTPHITNR